MTDRIEKAVLAGGKALRLHGMDKSQLRLGTETYLNRILMEMVSENEAESTVVLLSYNRKAENLTDVKRKIRVIPDLISDVGPIGGLYTLLKSCKEEWLHVVSCDMPYYHRIQGDVLAEIIKKNDDNRIMDAVVFRTRDGRIQPLCGIYSKRCLNLLEKNIREKKYRMTELLTELNTCCLDAEEYGIPEQWFENVNEIAEKFPQVVCICGRKHVGKTTYAEGLISVFVKNGYRVGFIKHDGHDFTPDVPGTDTWRAASQGTSMTAIFSDTQSMMYGRTRMTAVKRVKVQEQADAMVQSMVEQSAEPLDLIIIEGMKSSNYSKIEIVRKEVGHELVSEGGRLLAVCTDLNSEETGYSMLQKRAERIFELENYEEMAQYLMHLCKTDASMRKKVRK